MNDDYLWDRTGEPDPEVQQLEDVLGTLRYQPQPLVLPDGLQPRRRRGHVPPLAIAATVALMILAGALWLRFQRRQMTMETTQIGPKAIEQKTVGPRETASPSTGPRDQQAAVNRDRQAGNQKRRPPARPVYGVAKHLNKQKDNQISSDVMTAAQREEISAAKEQLVLALRLASAKLNLAQRKAQGTPPAGTIHNQHKIG